MLESESSPHQLEIVIQTLSNFFETIDSIRTLRQNLNKTNLEQSESVCIFQEIQDLEDQVTKLGSQLKSFDIKTIDLEDSEDSFLKFNEQY